MSNASEGITLTGDPAAPLSQGYTSMADWKRYVHTLAKPLEIDGRRITTVTLREPDAEALELIEETGVFANVFSAADAAAEADAASVDDADAASVDDAVTGHDAARVVGADYLAGATPPAKSSAAAASAGNLSIRQTRLLVEALIEGDRRVAKRLSLPDLTALAEAAGPLLESGMLSSA